MTAGRSRRSKPLKTFDDSPASLPGLGPKTAAWLAEVGITTVAELRQVGAVAAYARLKHRDPKQVSRNALWGLYAALNGMRWTDISAEVKARLLSEAGE
jgi:DNA transformation protein